MFLKIASPNAHNIIPSLECIEEDNYQDWYKGYFCEFNFVVNKEVLLTLTSLGININKEQRIKFLGDQQLPYHVMAVLLQYSV